MNRYQALKPFIETLTVLYIGNDSAQSTLPILEQFMKRIDVVTHVKQVIEAFGSFYEKHGKYYDIVIIDTDMPGLDGIKLCSTLLSRNQQQAIIVLSQSDGHFTEFIEAGVWNVLLKPINEAMLQSQLWQIASVLQKQTMIQEQNAKIETITHNLESAKKKAEEASHQKSYFLANMSHEIRTPLNAIMGFITLLKEQERDKERLKYFEVLEDSSNSLLKVINDILDITKIESGKLEIDNIAFDPYKRLIHTTELFQENAAQDGVVFKVKVNKSLPKMLKGDPFRIQQIFSNLLGNAIKFTPEGSIVKAIIWYKDGTLNLRVKDYGIGIVKEKHEYIFEAFNQADNRMATEYGGTGLGLALCSELTSLMGGELSFEDNKKGGSIFTFKVRLPEMKQETDNTAKNKRIPGKPDLNGHILVVEDIEANRMFIGIVLENMGLSYETAVDGFDAIEKFKKGHFDLILMDENMPKLNGTDAAKKIMKIEEEKGLAHTPVVSLTANALKGDKERLLEAGMDDYLSKPLQPDDLQSVLQKFL